MYATFPATEEEQISSEILTARIHEKITDYERYRFTPRQSWALNIFFDLAQEFKNLHTLYHLPGEVLRVFFDIDSEFYSYDKECAHFTLRTKRVGVERRLPDADLLLAGPLRGDNCWHFPVRGRIVTAMAAGAEEPENYWALQQENYWELQQENTPYTAPENAGQTPYPDLVVLGVLTLYSATPMHQHALLYYEKFANRVGFCLHNRLLAEKNREHIRFVRSLVHDIGHNVIVPNMYFKLLLKQMDGKLTALGKECAKLAETPSQSAIQTLTHLHGRLEEQYKEILRHFQQSSFFLETLLRQSHFDKGSYVLQTSSLDLVQQIAMPQVERYRSRFDERGIRVEEAYPGAAESPLIVEADRGLLSQVLANLLSNATKYTRENPGLPGLFMRCGAKRIADYFGPGSDGARLYVLTSGPAVPGAERERLFNEHFRASNTGEEYGTGHGLYFTRLIMQEHKGEAGYARTEEGNVFHITLPCLPAGAA